MAGISFYIPYRGVAQGLYWFWQLAALTTMIAAMSAIVQHKKDIVEGSNDIKSALTTIHSWLGVSAILMFCLNLMIAIFTFIITKFMPESSVNDYIDLEFVNRSISHFAFGLTTSAVLTGIMNQFGEGGCVYVLTVLPESTPDPAEYYPDIPVACKIANGLGIVVIIIAILTVLIVSLQLNRVSKAAIAAAAAITVPSVGDISIRMPYPTDEIPQNVAVF